MSTCFQRNFFKGDIAMHHNSSEKGQALIIIALAAIVLFGFAALAIDGSRIFSDKRHAQNAADTSALAGALAYTRNDHAGDDDDDDGGGGMNVIRTAARDRATSNGYDDGATNDVTVTATDVPSGGCPGNVAGKDITVEIVSNVNTTFARVIGRTQVTNVVTATTRACGFYQASLFDGNAVVGLNPSITNCAFDSGQSNSAHWAVEGGGIFSNGCAHSKNNNSVDLIDGCVTSVGSASNFSCQQPFQISQAKSYPAYVLEIMPPNPCDGTAGDVGLAPPASGSTFNNGVYCISNLDAYDQKDVILNNATLYVTDTDFNLKFAGGGGFSGTPSSSGDFMNYYMVIAYDSTPCPAFNDNDSQIIQFRGNGNGTFSGTILAPSACLDLRGNGDTNGIHSQIIGYNVSSNGNAGGNSGDESVYINFQEDENHKIPVYPSISLLR
jgi:Flp pilus assembly protein TadG